MNYLIKRDITLDILTYILTKEPDSIITQKDFTTDLKMGTKTLEFGLKQLYITKLIKITRDLNHKRFSITLLGHLLFTLIYRNKTYYNEMVKDAEI